MRRTHEVLRGVVTASSSKVIRGINQAITRLIINVTSISGAGASILFTVTEVDPADETTAVGTPVSSVAITATGVVVVEVPAAGSPTFLVAWTVAGTTPSITVAATLVDQPSDYGATDNPLHVVASPPSPPPSTTPVQLDNSSPLSTNGTTTTAYTIPAGKTFTLQQVEAGGQEDPTESGTVVEVFYYDGSAEHIVTRIYVSGFTVSVAPNTSAARDGTVMTGDGSTKLVRLRRRRLSGGSQEVDSLLRGYVQ